MKKFVITLLVFAAFSFPLLAQIDHDINANDVEIPESGFKLDINNIPTSVLKAEKTDFNLQVPATWTKFPYALHEYGWVYDKAAADVKPDRYQVTMKTLDGNKMNAVYSADGTLIATREESSNIPVPAHVMQSILNSKYKDWKVVGDRQIIRYFHDKKSVEQHFRVTLSNGTEQRTVSFNYQGNVNMEK